MPKTEIQTQQISEGVHKSIIQWEEEYDFFGLWPWYQFLVVKCTWTVSFCSEANWSQLSLGKKCREVQNPHDGFISGHTTHQTC